MAPQHQLAFEKPIYEIEERLDALKESTVDHEDESIREELRSLRRQRIDLTREIYGKLEPWETVEVARHPDRPRTSDYLKLAFEEFVELHGDRAYGDDRALRVGFAKIGGNKVLVAGLEKGRTLDERTACNFGCAHPEGYRKALAKMKLAAKYGLPVVTLIDTPGAYPGVGAEERGQASIIAECIYEMSRLRTPVVCVVIGEGGSGGALAVGVGDKIAILQYAYYSVISPEGCAGILWKSHAFKQQAAKALRFTSSDLKSFGVVDDVIEEPLGGAHRDHHQAANLVKQYLARSIREIGSRPIDDVLSDRYEKFRRIGVFVEDGQMIAGGEARQA
ncbi:MAG: acetyl-CoA carboxylase carboxyltransferase subunit alpha [Pirellulales bacterium]|nr:acetyl-CoA carboxylase carboxyltransferase subunit alpha [Pirellulales bacterium]